MHFKGLIFFLDFRYTFRKIGGGSDPSKTDVTFFFWRLPFSPFLIIFTSFVYLKYEVNFIRPLSWYSSQNRIFYHKWGSEVTRTLLITFPPYNPQLQEAVHFWRGLLRVLLGFCSFYYHIHFRIHGVTVSYCHNVSLTHSWLFHIPFSHYCFSHSVNKSYSI